MDSVWFLAGCGGFFWLVLWSLRDFEKPSRLFWPFDTRWMKHKGQPGPQPWRRGAQGRNDERP